MDDKNPQEVEPKAAEIVDLNELIKAVAEDKREAKYDVEKFQNNEDVKKISMC